MPDTPIEHIPHVPGDISPFAWPAYAGLVLTQNTLEVWSRAWVAWADMADRLALGAGGSFWLDALTRSACESLEISEHVVADRLARGGVTQPLLNDP